MVGLQDLNCWIIIREAKKIFVLEVFLRYKMKLFSFFYVIQKVIQKMENKFEIFFLTSYGIRIKEERFEKFPGQFL